MSIFKTNPKLAAVVRQRIAFNRLVTGIPFTASNTLDELDVATKSLIDEGFINVVNPEEKTQ